MKKYATAVKSSNIRIINEPVKVGKPSTGLSDLENEKIEKIKARVLKDIISRPKGTIKVEKTWMIDDSELNNIPIIGNLDLREFLQKRTIRQVVIKSQKIYHRASLKSKRA
jgi:hypothetical protein